MERQPVCIRQIWSIAMGNNTELNMQGIGPIAQRGFSYVKISYQKVKSIDICLDLVATRLGAGLRFTKSCFNETFFAIASQDSTELNGDTSFNSKTKSTLYLLCPLFGLIVAFHEAY